ncbi:MAG: hypothetical protein ACT4PM_13315 [Gemmatimonadales bacterium]
MIGIGAGLGVAAGLIRDTRAGEPVLAIDLSQRSDWNAIRFRPWRTGNYRLFLSTVNFDSTHLGAPFGGMLETEVLNEAGQPVFRRRYGGGETGHVLPWNYGDQVLATLPIPRSVFHRWTLAVRIPEGDPRFNGATSELKLWRERNDPGMGGLVNYALSIPAGLFLVAALVLSVVIAGRGPHWPLIVSLVPLGFGIGLLVLF